MLRVIRVSFESSENLSKSCEVFRTTKGALKHGSARKRVNETWDGLNLYREVVLIEPGHIWSTFK